MTSSDDFGDSQTKAIVHDKLVVCVCLMVTRALKAASVVLGATWNIRQSTSSCFVINWSSTRPLQGVYLKSGFYLLLKLLHVYVTYPPGLLSRGSSTKRSLPQDNQQVCGGSRPHTDATSTSETDAFAGQCSPLPIS